MFPQRLSIPISPSNCRGILILQSITSIKSSYYHILLHLNRMQKSSNIKLLTLLFIQIPNFVKLVTEATICERFLKLSQKPKIFFFYNCSHTRQFWTDFASYWHLLSKQQIHLSLKDGLFGILSEKCPLLDLLNYFIIIGKLFLWDCRRSQTPPKIEGFKAKIKIKYEMESKITKKNILMKNG